MQPHRTRFAWGSAEGMTGRRLNHPQNGLFEMRAFRLRSVGALCWGFVIAGCATQGDPFSDATDRTFLRAAETWDVDKDGAVSCENWRSYLQSRFAEGDADRDGVLAIGEFPSLSKADRLFSSVGFRYWDSDRNGALTLAEMQQKPNPAFAHADKNKDCKLDPGELAGVRAALHPPRPNPPPNQGGPSGPAGAGGGRGGGMPISDRA